MRLYIDKDNLISLMNSRSQDSFEDCARSIRRELDVQYNFSKEDIKSNETLMLWFSRFGQGVKGKQNFVQENNPQIYPPRPLKSNFFNGQRDALTAIYLLNDEHICEVIQQKSCLLVGKIGEELNVLSSLLLEETETNTSRIPSWKDYCPMLPFTDLIICDNHYFKDQYIYEKNDNELIRALVEIPNDSPVNLVIFTKKGEVDRSINLEKEQKRIKEIVKKATGCKKSSVTIVVSYATHDRCLITNYYRIKHGSCFHLKNNNIKPDVTTEIKSHLKHNNEEVSLNLIEVFQDILNKSATCIGDKKSNFLNFR